MEFTARHRFAPISPSKARPVIDLIRGLSVNEALSVLTVTHKRAAPMIKKVLHSAMTAGSLDTDVDKLYVAKASVDDGPRRRWRLPRARGYATPILHRMSHITITLSDQEEE